MVLCHDRPGCGPVVSRCPAVDTRWARGRRRRFFRGRSRSPRDSSPTSGGLAGAVELLWIDEDVARHAVLGPDGVVGPAVARRLRPHDLIHHRLTETPVALDRLARSAPVVRKTNPLNRDTGIPTNCRVRPTETPSARATASSQESMDSPGTGATTLTGSNAGNRRLRQPRTRRRIPEHL